MTRVVAISAKKCGGKNTAANFLYGLAMYKSKLTNEFYVNENGKLVVQSEDKMGVFVTDWNEAPKDFGLKYEDWFDFMANNVWPLIKHYSFAEVLKRDICVNVLGLTNEQCFGTNEQKNTLTHLKWEDMPGVTTCGGFAFTEESFKIINNELSFYRDYVTREVGKLYYCESGFMTAREVMQYVGTEVFRKMYSNVWVDATVNLINKEGPALAVITDCRFPNEVEGIQKIGGKVIRLLRDPNNGKDQHKSETALDDFPFEKFDAVIDNSEMTIEEQNDAVYSKLKEWKFIIDD